MDIFLEIYPDILPIFPRYGGVKRYPLPSLFSKTAVSGLLHAYFYSYFCPDIFLDSFLNFYPGYFPFYFPSSPPASLDFCGDIQQAIWMDF